MENSKIFSLYTHWIFNTLKLKKNHYLDLHFTFKYKVKYYNFIVIIPK